MNYSKYMSEIQARPLSFPFPFAMLLPESAINGLLRDVAGRSSAIADRDWVHEHKAPGIHEALHVCCYMQLALRTGPTTRDIMTTMSQSREHEFHMVPFSVLPIRRGGRRLRFRSPWSIPSSASLNDVLGLVEAEPKTHATCIASRRTAVHIGMYGVIVQRAEVLTA